MDKNSKASKTKGVPRISSEAGRSEKDSPSPLQQKPTWFLLGAPPKPGPGASAISRAPRAATTKIPAARGVQQNALAQEASFSSSSLDCSDARRRAVEFKEQEVAQLRALAHARCGGVDALAAQLAELFVASLVPPVANGLPTPGSASRSTWRVDGTVASSSSAVQPPPQVLATAGQSSSAGVGGGSEQIRGLSQSSRTPVPPQGTLLHQSQNAGRSLRR